MMRLTWSTRLENLFVCLFIRSGVTKRLGAIGHIDTRSPSLRALSINVAMNAKARGPRAQCWGLEEGDRDILVKYLIGSIKMTFSWPLGQIWFMFIVYSWNSYIYMHATFVICYYVITVLCFKLPSVLLNISLDKFIRLYDASDNVVCTALRVN